MNILKNINHPSVSSIKNLPKLERNTKIGLLMKSEPYLTEILRSTTINAIDDYILKNEISKDDIVIRQYDGFLTTKKLKNLNIGIPLNLQLRNTYSIFIISSNRDSFIATDFNEYSLKGIPNRYSSMDEIYKKILNINYLCKTSVFSSMDKIKNEILKTEDPDLYFIEDEDKTKGSLILLKYGNVKVSRSILSMMDTNDIDKQFYYDKYIKMFAESILIEFL